MSAFEITVMGLVQGIGFRPFVAEYAEKNGLVGSIHNAGGVVKLYVECDEIEIGKLTYHLRYNCPAGGRVDNIIVKPVKDIFYDDETSEISKELEESARKMYAAEQEEDEYMNSRSWFAEDKKKQAEAEAKRKEAEEKEKQKDSEEPAFSSEVGASDDEGNVTEGIVLDEYGRELDDSFRIIKSEGFEEGMRFLPTDLATCDDCRAELLDPTNRRYRYPFISCSACGPRYSIMKSVPYDRENSTMAPFHMCQHCARDYHEPGNRRRFDQNIGCSDCGPKLRYYENRLVDEIQMEQDEMLDKTIENLKAGKIGAIKSLGGFHFVCVPTNEAAIRKLRAFKDKQHKPFGLLFPDLETIKKYCYVSEVEEELLTSNARPIVILAKKEGVDDFVPEVLMGATHIGAMLPFDPLQIILSDACGPLVMTSGNKGGEPIITKDKDMIMYLPRVDSSSLTHEEVSAVDFVDGLTHRSETLEYLEENEEEICLDFMLTNTREILAPLDDSIVQVARIHSGKMKRRLPQIIRRARGYIPQPIMLDIELPKETFAGGTDYESSFALGVKNAIYLSEYYGNMTNGSVNEVRSKAVERMEDLLGIKPKLFLGDLNPDYISSKDADKRAMETYIDGIPQRVQRRQHHAAHVLSVAAEHGLTGRVLGIAYDGTGYGLDDTIWGSELFSCMLNESIEEEVDETGATVETRPKILRSGALMPIKLMGGEQSARDVKTTLCGYIRSVEERQLVSPTTIDKVFKILGIDRGDYGVISACLKADINIYYSACMGRLFDAVAALLGIKSKNTFGGESPMALEEAATRGYRRKKIMLQDIVAEDLKLRVIEPKSEEEIYRMDQATLIADLMEKMVAVYEMGLSDEEYKEKIDELAFEFHAAIINSTVYICDKVCSRDYIHHIAITGGSMYNRLLLDGLGSSLERLGYKVFINNQVPAGDGGVCLGQIYGEII